jgi:hypothetical protein
MTDSVKTGIDPTELAALLAALPQDSAGAVIEQLRVKVKAQEADAKRREIVAGVSSILADVAEELVALIPVGKELSVRHVGPTKGDDGKDVPARLVFDVDMGAGLSSLGGTKADGKGRKGPGGIKKMRLDGAELVADSWRAMLDTVNAGLKARGSEPIKVPTSSFNARALLIQASPKIKGLEYVGDMEAVPTETK